MQSNLIFFFCFFVCACRVKHAMTARFARCKLSQLLLAVKNKGSWKECIAWPGFGSHLSISSYTLALRGDLDI